MEGKAVILSVVMLSLVLPQFQVEATGCSCPTGVAEEAYTACRGFFTDSSCCKAAGCTYSSVQTSSTGAAPYDHRILENSGDDKMKSYCKLGCVSSVCNNIKASALQGKVAIRVVEQCVDTCSNFCNNASIRQLQIETA